MAKLLNKIVAAWLILALGYAPVGAALASAGSPAEGCPMHHDAPADTAQRHAGHAMHEHHAAAAAAETPAASACPHCTDAGCAGSGCGTDDCGTFHAPASVPAAPWVQAYLRADSGIAADVWPTISRHDPPLPRPPS